MRPAPRRARLRPRRPQRPAPGQPDPRVPTADGRRPLGHPPAQAQGGSAEPDPEARTACTRWTWTGPSVTCGIRVRPPKPPVRNADLAPYLRSLVKCLVKVHRKPLAAQGFTLTEPKIRVYRSIVTAACGRFDQKGAPAYYCSADQTIYWPATRDDGREAYTFARLGYVALLAHEFGHHLQAVTGMVNAYGREYATADTAERTRPAQPPARAAGAVLRGRVPRHRGPLDQIQRRGPSRAADLARLHRRRGPTGQPRPRPRHQRRTDALAGARPGQPGLPPLQHLVRAQVKSQIGASVAGARRAPQPSS